MQQHHLPDSVFYHASVAANGFVYVLGGGHFTLKLKDLFHIRYSLLLEN